jgi:hypothetical protein
MSESLRDNQGGPRRWGPLLLAMLLVVLLGSVGALLWQRYNPFFDRQPVVREATDLRDAARRGPLTDEEFERVLVILGSGNEVAQLSAIATIELEVSRAPARRDRATDALEQCQQKAEPRISQAAKVASARLKVGPKGQ